MCWYLVGSWDSSREKSVEQFFSGTRGQTAPLAETLHFGLTAHTNSVRNLTSASRVRFTGHLPAI